MTHSSIGVIKFELKSPYDTVSKNYIIEIFKKQKIGYVVHIEYKSFEGSDDNWRIKSKKYVYVHIQWYDNIISFNIKRYLINKGFAKVVHNDPDTWIIESSSESLNYEHESEPEPEPEPESESEPESDYYDSDTSVELCIEQKEFCIICKKNVLKKIHRKECPYCILCKKYGHCSCTTKCTYCNFCKLYGHSFNDCLIYEEYVKYIGKNMIRHVFGPLYNEYFHMYYKNYTSEIDGYDFVSSLIPVYNHVQRKRTELNDLLMKTPLIKISNLLFLLDELSSKNIAFAYVLHNNDLLLIIKSFV